MESFYVQGGAEPHESDAFAAAGGIPRYPPGIGGGGEDFSATDYFGGLAFESPIPPSIGGGCEDYGGGYDDEYTTGNAEDWWHGGDDVDGGGEGADGGGETDPIFVLGGMYWDAGEIDGFIAGAGFDDDDDDMTGLGEFYTAGDEDDAAPSDGDAPLDPKKKDGKPDGESAGEPDEATEVEGRGLDSFFGGARAADQEHADIEAMLASEYGGPLSDSGDEGEGEVPVHGMGFAKRRDARCAVVGPQPGKHDCDRAHQHIEPMKDDDSA
jgi:hypothetical protein